MSSNKLMLFFLGFILLIIVMLTSRQIAGALRAHLGKFLPFQSSPTPTPTQEVIPTPTSFGEIINPTSPPYPYQERTGEIPATGPEQAVYLLISTSFLTGYALKKLTSASLK